MADVHVRVLRACVKTHACGFVYVLACALVAWQILSRSLLVTVQVRLLTKILESQTSACTGTLLE